MERFERKNIKFFSLKERYNKVDIEKSFIRLDAEIKNLSDKSKETLDRMVDDILIAKKNAAPVILAFGAHSIKNGLGFLLSYMIEKKWITHLATNGAGVIHDWEFSFQGKSSEVVRDNLKDGKFGIWEETGFYINMAINIGAYDGFGYGQGVGKFISTGKLLVPSRAELKKSKSVLASELLEKLDYLGLESGEIILSHPYKKYSLQAKAYELGVPFTAHPMFGCDIIYTHPANSGCCLGKAAEHDFLSLVNSISHLEKGVYISIGSAVMSPMNFEKALSMSRNVVLQQNRTINDFAVYVVDLAESQWDWQNDGEPPEDRSEYYLRYCKTFSRANARTMDYITADNRDVLLYLYRNLSLKDKKT